MRLTLNISQEEAIERLRAKTNTDYTPIRLLYGIKMNLKQEIYAEINKDSFWIFDLGAYADSGNLNFIQQLTGKFSTENDKTVVDYKFGFTDLNYGFFGLLYALIIFLNLCSGLSSWARLLAITAGFLVFAAFAFGIGFLTSKEYKKRSIDNFLNIYSDCIE